jgi:hypothetical protein
MRDQNAFAVALQVLVLETHGSNLGRGYPEVSRGFLQVPPGRPR